MSDNDKKRNDKTANNSNETVSNFVLSQAITSDNQQNQFLSFFVAGEEYALGILEVKEIVELSKLTKIPSVPSAIRGVVNLRGRVVPVLDLALLFGLTETNITKRTCVVMIEAEWEGEQTVVGLLADAVSQVIELPKDSVQAAPAFGTKAKVDFLKGMANIGDKFVLILDLNSVLHYLAIDTISITDNLSKQILDSSANTAIVNSEASQTQSVNI
ncbi:MAG: purine-binding chemotaxis protein CheW [Deltaproteobacteria bacterium]|nr:purine-binding chemotaxis protein CheW [Deltaproteobacteria bacterium]